MRKTALCAVVAVAVLLVVAACGCGGGGAAPPPADTGSVTGQVRYLITDQPLGGVTVSVIYLITVDGQDVTQERSAVSDENGNFRINGIPAGRNRLLRVVPPAWLAVPSATAVYVDVAANETTILAAPIMLIPSGEGPPDVPAM